MVSHPKGGSELVRKTGHLKPMKRRGLLVHSIDTNPCWELRNEETNPPVNYHGDRWKITTLNRSRYICNCLFFPASHVSSQRGYVIIHKQLDGSIPLIPNALQQLRNLRPHLCHFFLQPQDIGDGRSYWVGDVVASFKTLNITGYILLSSLKLTCSQTKKWCLKDFAFFFWGLG